MCNGLFSSILAGAALLLLGGAPASAVVIAEAGDAGQLPGSAQVLPGGTTSVSGALSVSGDVDLYRFGWDGGAITIDTSGSTFDTQLSLFDGAGFGILHDDDSGSGLLALIDTVLAAGEYLIGISAFNNDPVSAGGNIFPAGFPGPFGPTGPGGEQPLSGWTGGGATGSYVINFSAPTAPLDGAVVPEPAIASLVGVGLILMGVMGRRFAG